jgi:hypothetical protein
MWTMRQIVRVSLVVITLTLAGTSEAWACPMCKLALETDDPQPRAYMMSILFMLGMIGSMFGGMAGLLIWLARRERLELEAAGYGHLFDNGVTQLAAASPR